MVFFLNSGVIRKINTEFPGISDKTVLKMLKFYGVLNLNKDERVYLQNQQLFATEVLMSYILSQTQVF